jgi:hypothetical protein
MMLSTPTPRRLQALGNGMHHGGAHAAPDAERAARGNQFRGVAQRPGDIGDGLARLQRHQFLGALAHRLDDQRDSAGARIRVGDGQRDALRAFGPVHNDKLAGLPDLRNPRGTTSSRVTFGLSWALATISGMPRS